MQMWAVHVSSCPRGQRRLVGRAQAVLEGPAGAAQVLQVVEVLAELPKTVTGKIQCFRLREREARQGQGPRAPHHDLDSANPLRNSLAERPGLI